MDRHISMGPGFQYDEQKSEEENRIARKEYYKKIGVDIENISQEEKQTISEMVKRNVFDNT